MLFFAISDSGELGVFERLDEVASAVEPDDASTYSILDLDGNVFRLRVERRCRYFGPRWLRLRTSSDVVVPWMEENSDQYSELVRGVVDRLRYFGVDAPIESPLEELGLCYLRKYGARIL